jgi:filamin
MSIDVTYDEMAVPQSPLKVNATPGSDASRVRAYGPGLEGAITSRKAEFTVDIKGAGQGGLGLAIDGPAETQIGCKDNHDGTCTVDYLPVKPGDYAVSVKFADQDIPGNYHRQLNLVQLKSNNSFSFMSYVFTKNQSGYSYRDLTL